MREKGNGSNYLMDLEFIFGVMPVFWTQTKMVATQHEHTECHRSVQFKMADSVLCKFCFNLN